MSEQPTKPRILIYILRRDIRLSDNPIFHRASLFALKPIAQSESSETNSREDSVISETDFPDFTHLLPVYICPANQIEVSGFLSNSSQQSPYPQARSRLAGVWRTGPHRANFIAEGVWNLKEKLEELGCGSGLEIRVGTVADVVRHMLDFYFDENRGDEDVRPDVAGIWMTAEEGTEERSEQNAVRRIAMQKGVDFQLWDDEKYYVDDRDLPFNKDTMSDLPNVYTTYRKTLEPLRSRPRKTLTTPTKLPPLPQEIPPQEAPFEIPTTLEGFKNCLLFPMKEDLTFGLSQPPKWPENVQSAYPLAGGESAGQNRLAHLVSSGAMSSYKATRNGLVGLDFSTKLSAYLAQGHLTARQVHWAMMDFEEGKGEGKGIEGYGKGENEGTAAVRFELLWRDYMRLYARKFKEKIFNVHGIRDYPEMGQHDQHQPQKKNWKFIDKDGAAGHDPAKTREVFERFRSGRTGIGLIDASNRELFLTGYTSNRARQNVASFLASHLGIDWRIGAEWYEFLLIDHDVGNNWGNWQYVAGVGNDPRQGRVFNPVKQALDYDKKGEYIRAWVPELRKIELKTKTNSGKEEIDPQRLMSIFQPWKMSEWDKDQLGFRGLDWVEQPLVRIQFSMNKRRGADGDARGRGRGNWRGKGRGKGFRRMGDEDKAEQSRS
ncbi:cryptochrome DASH [Dendryphion nanum]|uniref:Cryptochrome DASH n=1 Tax=Dendryphion nanum TaxID=256645 RepID=A0A9P9DNQ9_9PLEO|nr:cryptochrome DASH [Dendryphion nanum]